VLAFWCAVAQAARVQRLMAADPSLQLVRRRIDEGRRVAGGVGDRAKERARTETKARRRRRLKVVGGVLALLVAGVAASWLLKRQ